MSSDLRTEPTPPSGSQPFLDLWAAQSNRLHRASLALLKNRADAEEATQETVAKALAAWDTFRGPPGRRVTWISRIHYRACLDILRRRARSGGAVSEDVVDVRHDCAHVDDRILVRSALRELPVNERAAVVYRYYLDLKVNRVAEVLGLPTATAHNHIDRGMRRLASVLGQDGKGVA